MKSMVHMSWGARWCDLLSSNMMCWVDQSGWLISESSNTVYESQRMNSQNRLSQKQTNYFSVIIESLLCFLVILSNCSGGWVLLECHFRDRQFTKWVFLFILISAFLSLISQRSEIHSFSFIFWKRSFYLMRFFMRVDILPQMFANAQDGDARDMGPSWNVQMFCGKGRGL